MLLSRSHLPVLVVVGLMAVSGMACGTSRRESPPTDLGNAVNSAKPPSGRVEDVENRLEATIGQVFESAVALEYSADGAPKGARRVASGVVISDVGDVLSVRVDPPPSSSPIMARVASGRLLPARWIAGDPETGLTLLRISPGSVRPATVSTRGAKLGMPVLVVGNPFGLAHSVGRGFVAGLNRRLVLGPRQLGGLIQIDAPLHPGDSGALLADLRGDWLGVVRSGLAHPDRAFENKTDDARPGESGKTEEKDPGNTRNRDTRDLRHEYDHDLGFAIPATDALWVAHQLRDRGRVDRAYLGVTMNPEAMAAGGLLGEAEGAGAVLGQVLTDTPAERAGLLSGDRVVALDKSPVRSASDLTDRLDHTLADSEITVELVRGIGPVREHKTLRLRTAHRPHFGPLAPTMTRTDPAKILKVSESSKRP